MRLIRLLKKDLAKEITEWVAAEIITRDQGLDISRRYGMDDYLASGRSLGYNVLIGLGYLFIGLAVITLIGANWDDIPRGVRMGVLIAVTMGIQLFGLKKYLDGKTSAAIGLFLLGHLFYGASIILIAQIYHLGEHMPDGVFWWALGSIPIAVLVNSPLLALMSTLLGLLWLFLEIHMGFYPYCFPIFLISAFLVLYRGKSSILLFLTTVISSGFWIEYTLAHLWRDQRHFDFFPEHVAVSAALFIFVYAVSHWLNSRESHKAKDYGALMGVWGLRFGLVFMLIMSFEAPWEYLLTEDWNHLPSMMIIVIMLLGLSVGLIWRSYQSLPLLCFMALFGISLLTVVSSDMPQYALYLQILFNTALVGMGIWLIVRGIHSGISHYFFLGVATILATAFMRYVDLIGNYIGAAILFAFFAALLLGAARYWKNYRRKGGAV